MSKHLWFRVAGLSGASSVAAAAYGAHALKGEPTLLKSYENGQRLHMVHSVMLAICPLLARPHLTGCLFLGGTVVFSGSCYAAALTGNRENGKFAPLGGSTLIIAWLTMALT